MSRFKLYRNFLNRMSDDEFESWLNKEDFMKALSRRTPDELGVIARAAKKLKFVVNDP